MTILNLTTGPHIATYVSYHLMSGGLFTAGVEARYVLYYDGDTVRALSRFEGGMSRLQVEADFRRAIKANLPRAAA